MQARDVFPRPSVDPSSLPAPGRPAARPRWRAARLAAGLAFSLIGPVRADAPIAVEARLHTPPDSHEPQRALVTVSNAGPDAVARLTLACTFLGADDAALERGTATIGTVAAGETARAEVIYYGWPRARRVACARTGP
jgi:hypothetical protein